MNVGQVVSQLKRKYPGKRIIKNDEDNPTEILCEIEPSSEHPEWSMAVVVLDESKPHYHKKTTEIYEVIEGKLTVVKGGKNYNLVGGERLEIRPGEIHSAIGNETWFKTYSEPGWVLEDHILEEEK